MRKNWMEPQIEVQQFMANEYVAACGDQNVIYKFQCDAGRLEQWGISWSGDVYVDSNNSGQLDSGDTKLGSYHACNIKHDAEKKEEAFVNGFYVPDLTDRVIPVIIWRGAEGNNIHCTTNLNMDSWETAKS